MKLTAAARKRIPTHEFGLTAARKYPMPDCAHARNAKARASQMRHEGRITAAQERTIDRKADKILKKCKKKGKHDDGDE